MEIRFNSSASIPYEVLIQVGRSIAPVTYVVRTTPDLGGVELNDHTLHAIEEVQSGQFPYYYTLHWLMRGNLMTKRQEVDFLVNLTSHFPVELLTDDEGSDPYLFIHVKPNTEPTTVGVDADVYNSRDELKVAEYYLLAWGIISLQTELTADDRALVFSYLQKITPSFTLVPLAKEVIDVEFIQSQKQFPELLSFQYFFLITPQDKHVWYSKNEKSELIENALEEFNTLHRVPVCLFLVNGSRVENIPGGSDRESHLILFSSEGKQKIIYKKLRKSWS